MTHKQIKEDEAEEATTRQSAECAADRAAWKEATFVQHYGRGLNFLLQEQNAAKTVNVAEFIQALQDENPDCTIVIHDLDNDVVDEKVYD